MARLTLGAIATVVGGYALMYGIFIAIKLVVGG